MARSQNRQREDMKVGRVIAHYDMDNRQSGRGRGADDSFMPTEESIERGNKQRLRAERGFFGSTPVKMAIFTTLGVAVAAGALFLIGALTSEDPAEAKSSV